MTFKLALALSSIAALSSAACLAGGDCENLSMDLSDQIQDAVATYANDVTWEVYEAAQNADNTLPLLRAYRFVAKANGDPRSNQGNKGEILFIHTATRDCTSWLTSTVDENETSIPLRLWQQGYDVWFACRRGTAFSRDDDADTNEDYWDYDTGSIGKEDIPRFINLITETKKTEDEVDTCDKIQVITHGLGTAEMLVTASTYPEITTRFVSNVINLAPCAIPTYQNPDRGMEAANEHRRLHAEDTDVMNEKYRELSEALDSRKLWHYIDWDAQREVCEDNPDFCYNFCYYKPYKCKAFCQNLPEYCRPKEIDGYMRFIELAKENGVFSFYGPNWESQVEDICADLPTGSALCSSLESTLELDPPLKEMSCKQLVHMWQNSYTREFEEFNPDFFTNGWLDDTDTPDFPVENVTVNMFNFFVEGDSTCDPEANQPLLDPLAYFRGTFTKDSITHINVQGNNQEAVYEAIRRSLNGFSNIESDDCTLVKNWADLSDD